jgi:hypothetical protein
MKCSKLQDINNFIVVYPDNDNCILPYCKECTKYDNELKYKICILCKKKQKYTEYYNCNTTKDGKRGNCKTCQKKKAITRMSVKKDEWNNYQRTYVSKLDDDKREKRNAYARNYHANLDENKKKKIKEYYKNYNSVKKDKIVAV